MQKRSKVGRVITKWGAIEKTSTLLSQYGKNGHIYKVLKIISSFNILVDCISSTSNVLGCSRRICSPRKAGTNLHTKSFYCSGI